MNVAVAKTRGENMEVINNTDKLLGDDLKYSIKKGSKLSIAASCFSIYAYEALLKELNQVDEVRFIFTSPAFVADSFKRKNVSSTYPNEVGKKFIWHRV